MKESTSSSSAMIWNGSKYQDDSHVHRSVPWYFGKVPVEPMDTYWNTGSVLILVVVGLLSWGFGLRRKQFGTLLSKPLGATWKQQKSNDANRRKEEFLTRNHNVYGYRDTPGGYIDQWRPIELPALQGPLDFSSSSNNPVDQDKEIYLDYAGSALPTQSQLIQIQKCTF